MLYLHETQCGTITQRDGLLRGALHLAAERLDHRLELGIVGLSLTSRSA